MLSRHASQLYSVRSTIDFNGLPVVIEKLQDLTNQNCNIVRVIETMRNISYQKLQYLWMLFHVNFACYLVRQLLRANYGVLHSYFK